MDLGYDSPVKRASPASIKQMKTIFNQHYFEVQRNASTLFQNQSDNHTKTLTRRGHVLHHQQQSEVRSKRGDEFHQFSTGIRKVRVPGASSVWLLRKFINWQLGK